MISLFWRCGGKPLLHPLAHGFLGRVTPWALTLRRRVLLAPPKWIAPDPAVRSELLRRREKSSFPKREDSGSFYIEDGRRALDHGLTSWESEEMYDVYGRQGVRVVQPFWDPDLVDLLYRTPPFLLLRDGRNKSLVRGSLAVRFPQLGFEQQRKLDAIDFYASSLHREGPEILKKLGKMRALANLGIIDERTADEVLRKVLARRENGKAIYRFWNIVNLESWARAHVS